MHYTKINFLAWRPHHIDHMLPIWNAINEEIRGAFFISHHIQKLIVPKSIKENVHEFSEVEEVISHLNKDKNLLAVSDVYYAFLNKLKIPLISTNHGAGQTYQETKHIEGTFRKNVVLELVANQYAANVYSKWFPHLTVIVTGCSKIDDIVTRKYKTNSGSKKNIAFSFHFDRKIVPETRSSFTFFKESIAKIAQNNEYNIFGHGHPLIINQLKEFYKENNIHVIDQFTNVLEEADLYVCDNSSTLFEFAAADKPVVVLNPPFYRRNVKHGLRFWEYSNVGFNCDDPTLLEETIDRALIDPEYQKRYRREAVKGVYSVLDGTAAFRVAQAMQDFLISFKHNDFLPVPYPISKKYPGVDQLIKNMVGDFNKDIWIYGGGEHTELLLSKFSGELKSQVKGILDKNPRIQSRIGEVKVYPASHLQNIDQSIILISSGSYEEEIFREIREEKGNNNIIRLYESNLDFQKDIFVELYS